MWLKNLFNKPKNSGMTFPSDPDFPFRTETHCHTSEGSFDAKQNGETMAQAYKETGYTSLFITEHVPFRDKPPYPQLPWEEKVHLASMGYYHAKEWGDKNELNVFFGLELRRMGTDFLIYGLKPDWIMSHRELDEASICELYDIVSSEGGMIIQAHPFRDVSFSEPAKQFPDCVDGFEVINARNSHPLHATETSLEWNKMAIELAQECNMPMTSGSDSHSISLCGGGILTKKPIETPQDYIELVLGSQMFLLTDGASLWNRYGKPVKKEDR